MNNPNTTIGGAFLELGMLHVNSMRARSAEISEQLQVDRDVAAVAKLGLMLAAERKKSAQLQRELAVMRDRALTAEATVTRFASAVRGAAEIKKARQ